jgi:lipopolysaccharide/colanic/teichoic acid biosynthesis glycosyltransferase
MEGRIAMGDGVRARLSDSGVRVGRSPTTPSDGGGWHGHTRRWIVRRVVLVCWDAVGWAVALVLAAALRNEFTLSEIEVRPLEALVAIAVAGQILIGLVLQTYRGRYPVGTVDDAVNLTTTTALVGCILFVVDFFVWPRLVPLSVPLLAVPFAVLLAVGSRLAFRLYREHRYRADHSHALRVIIYGAGIEGQQLLRLMLSDPAGAYLPVAFLDDDLMLRRHRLSGVDVHGTRNDIAAAAARSQADLLVIADRFLPVDDIREIASAATDAGLAVAKVPALSEMLKPLPASSLVPAPREPADNSRSDCVVSAGRAGAVTALAVQSRTKRLLDVVMAVTSAVILLPLLVVIAVVLRVTSGGVIYRAQRIGRNGEPFTMFKFVTMVPGDGGPRVTGERDPRITRVGHLLRASKLNELPQILNIIKGDMSFVGPRPEDPRYTAHYSADQRRVLTVRPGLTSRAFLQFGDEQAFIERARPGDIEEFYLRELLPEKLDIELEYVDNWSLREDLRILAGTVKGLLC